MTQEEKLHSKFTDIWKKMLQYQQGLKLCQTNLEVANKKYEAYEEENEEPFI